MYKDKLEIQESRDRFYSAYKENWGKIPDFKIAEKLDISRTSYSDKKGSKWFLLMKISDIYDFFQKYDLEFGAVHTDLAAFRKKVRSVNVNATYMEINFQFSEHNSLVISKGKEEMVKILTESMRRKS